MTEICDKCGKPVEFREQVVLEDGHYHSECADEILGIETTEE
ncbi:MAG: hypothetical protein NTZ83_02285 [Candidatus Pacearchaeota archaeon]|nr:hypothetical protein [Candidatus Pacearchaeota archaeon]